MLRNWCIMEKCLIDTSVLDKVINQNEKSIFQRLVSRCRPVVPVNMLEELFYRVIVVTVGSVIGSGKFFDIKRACENCTATNEVSGKPDVVLELIDNGFLKVVDVKI